MSRETSEHFNSWLEVEQARRLERTADLVFASHPEYRLRFRQLGIERGDIARVSDLSALPVTRKRDYADNPDGYRLHAGDMPTVSTPEATIAQVVYTTGSTSGQPVPFYDTNYDLAARIHQMMAMTINAGITRHDVILNLFPMTAVLHQGFLSAMYGGSAVGAKVVSGFTGKPSTPFDIYRDSDYVRSLVREHQPTVIWGITGYVRRIIADLASRGDDLSFLRTLVVAGEACPSPMRQALRASAREGGAADVVVQNLYGFTEMQGPGFECMEEGPVHIPDPERNHIEILDPLSHEPLPDGQTGLVALSHLDRRGTVLWRYLVGDKSSLERDRCSRCGRSGPRFTSPPARVDDLVKIRGTLVNPSQLVEQLRSQGGVQDLRITFELGRDGQGLERERVLVDVIADASGDTQNLLTDLAMLTKRVCELTPEVRMADEELLSEHARAYKFRRFRDLRDDGPAS